MDASITSDCMLLKNIIKIWRNWVFVEYKVHVDVDYSRNASCAINMISTFLLLSLGLYLCWRTIILHYHWAYTSAGGLLFSEGIIHLQSCNYYKNYDSLPRSIGYLNRFWLSCLGILTFKHFGFECI